MEEIDQSSTEKETFFQRYARWRHWLWSTLTDEAVLVYRRSAQGRTRLRVLLVEVFLFVREVVREFYNGQGTARAASLAYTTLLSLVPLTVAFSETLRQYFRDLFPEFQANFETFLNVIVPYQSAQISAEINRFAENAAKASSLGTVIFVIIAFRLFMAVESSVNEIWKATGGRNYRQRIRAFTMLLFWGPILITLSFITSASVERRLVFGPLLVGSNVTVFLVVMIAFIMLFWLVPATRVDIRAAAVGGAVTALLFQLVRYGFGLYTQTLLEGRMNVIYGTLGLAIVFLIALEMMWVVILLGVQISYVFQNLQGILRASEQRLESDPRFGLYFALRAMIEITRRFEAREDAPSSYRLAEELGATDEQMLQILRGLEDGRLVKEIGGDWTGFVPGGDPDRISIEEIIHCVEGTRRDIPRPDVPDIEKAAIARLFSSIEDCVGEAVREHTLGRLVREIYGKRNPSRSTDKFTLLES